MKQRFNLSECIVRPAKEEDEAPLITLAKGIWGGTDYLPKILPRWLHEPYFQVCEYRGKVIACLKLTPLPDHVLWFEGLRVHKSYQGRGVGSLMNREMFSLAASLKARDPLLSYEFCTYYRNVESLHLTKKLGFRVIDKFITLDRRGVARQSKPRMITDYDQSIFRIYPRYIPCGWQILHNCPETLEYLKPRIVIFETPQARYMLAGLAEKNVVLLSHPAKDLRAELPYFQYFYQPRSRYSIIYPLRLRRYRQRFLQAGFGTWENQKIFPANMLLLRLEA